ncbi:MAG: tetratricopeptide repeat protein [Planctomycetaceae bacterium]
MTTSSQTPGTAPSGDAPSPTPGGGGGLRPWMTGLGAIVVVAIAAVVFTQQAPEPRRTDREAADTGVDRNTAAPESDLPFIDRNPGYRGIQSCVPCHQERVAEFQQTNHFRTCRIPRVEDMPPAFSDSGIQFSARFPDTRFRLQQIGEEFFQTTIHDTANGEQSLLTRIDLVYGAGQTDDIYLAWDDDDRMHELPIAWLWPFGRLGASHFLHENGTGDYSRAMTVRCLECHSTWVQYEPGTVNLYRRSTALVGVTCENCHGPADKHIAWHESHPNSEIAEAIILPSALDRERRIEVCTHCHSNAVTHRQPPFSWQPGEPLDEYYRTQIISNPEDDHVANQIPHLRQSACFINSPEMTCITCHDPHHRQPAGRSKSESCMQCHELHDCGEQARLPADIAGNCVDCHMARRIKINVKFDMGDDNFVPATSRSRHDITIDPVARDETLLKWHRANSDRDGESAEVAELTGRLLQHWRAQAEAHETDDRFLAAIADVREAIVVRDSPELQQELKRLVEIQTKLYDDWGLALHLIVNNRLDEALAALDKILAVRPNDAEAHSKAGTIYAIRGQVEQATRHLQAATENDPNNAEGFGVQGRLAWIGGRFQEAFDFWKLAEEIEPFNAQIQFDLGLALLRLNRPSEALEYVRRASSIDPTRDDIRDALNQMEIRSGDSPQTE